MEEIELGIIDSALDKFLDEFIPDESSEEEFNEKSNLFMALYADLVDDGLIPEVPEDESDDQLKNEWVEKAIPVLREHMQGELNDPDLG